MSAHLREELDQLRLQVEVMAARVAENLDRMTAVLDTGDEALAAAALAADDGIDAMNVSLTERCHDLLCREQPMASDLRLVVSVLRVIGELERVGDLALRVVKLAPDVALLDRYGDVLPVVRTMAVHAVDLFADAVRAWASLDLELSSDLAAGSRTMDALLERLVGRLLVIDGPDAVRVALAALVAGRSLERIADHACIIGARLRYLITGDPEHLAAEIRA